MVVAPGASPVSFGLVNYSDSAVAGAGGDPLRASFSGADPLRSSLDFFGLQ